MDKRDVGSVVFLQDDRILGLLTKSALIKRVIGLGKEDPAARLYCHRVQALACSETLSTALQERAAFCCRHGISFLTCSIL